jgi:hypothetical protein
MMNKALDKDNKGQIWSIQEEAGMYYTLTDAHELIRAIGLRNFLESLYHEKKGRLLTVEEHEAMETLHNSWEL